MSGFKKATKQIDKLSQWTGERLFKEEKTQLSSALREIEQEIDARTRGVERLSAASQTYVKTLSKKDKLEDPELAASNGKEKVLPVEALGLVMMHLGDSLGRGSEYGEALNNLGRAQCKIAHAQDEFLNSLSSAYLEGIDRTHGTLKDYQASRKKLDSRRLAMDAAVKRMQNSKKKEDRGLEEEVRVAKARFEEIEEDVELRIEAVRESESESVHDLGGFLDAHLTFIESYREILLDVKKNWSNASSNTRPRALSQPRPSYRVSVYETPPSSSPESSRPSSSSGLPTTTGNRARSNSARSEKGSSSGGLFSSLRKKGKWDALDDDRHATHAEEDEDDHQVKNGRQHGDEYSREGGAVSPGMGARSRSAGATSTLSAVLAGGNGASGSSLPPPAGVGMVRRNTAPLSPVDPNEKVVKALFAFTGSAADELDLLVGDVIVITSEVSDDWYQGRNEKTGEKGLFPSAYTQAFQRPAPPFIPPLPSSLRPTVAPSSSASISRSGSSYGLQPPAPSRLRPNSIHSSIDGPSDSDRRPPSFNGFSSEEERDLDEDEDAENDKAGLTSSAYRPQVNHSRFPSFGGTSKKGPAPPPPPSRRLTVSNSSSQLHQSSVGAGRGGWGGGRASSKSVGAREDSERNPFFG